MNKLYSAPFGLFEPGDSIMHRLDARAKLLALILLMTSAAFAQSWAGLGGVALATIGVIALGGLKWKSVLGDVWSMRFFYIITLLLHIIFNSDGAAIFTFGWGSITTNGVAVGTFFCGKIAVLAALGGVSNRTTHPASLPRAIDGLLPASGLLRRSFGGVATMMGISLRMLPTLTTEAERIRTSQAARGLNIGSGNLIARVRNLAALVVPLLSAAMRRGDQLTDAMQVRGFQMRAVRSGYNAGRWGGMEYLFLAAAAGFSVAGALLR